MDEEKTHPLREPEAEERAPAEDSVVFYEFAFVAGERVVEGFDKDVRVDEVAGPFLPGREDFFLLHLTECFVRVDGFLDDGGGFLEHFHERTDIIEIGKRAVAGNHFHIGRKLRGSFFERINHALNAATARDIDEGKAVTDKIVAHVHDIVFGEEDDGIAVGVAGRKMERANIFAVEMDGYIVLKRDDRERGFFGGFYFHL